MVKASDFKGVWLKHIITANHTDGKLSYHLGRIASGCSIGNHIHEAWLETHGLGLFNIQRCAKKYMGDIDIVVSDTYGRKKFSFMIMLNGKTAAAKKLQYKYESCIIE